MGKLNEMYMKLIENDEMLQIELQIKIEMLEMIGGIGKVDGKILGEVIIVNIKEWESD